MTLNRTAVSTRVPQKGGSEKVAAKATAILADAGGGYSAPVRQRGLATRRRGPHFASRRQAVGECPDWRTLHPGQRTAHRARRSAAALA
eukprot:61542-Pleurochrysis_carterae.AAC.1